MDPLAQLAPDMTPYHYTHNNPLNRIDPFGLSEEDPDNYEGDIPPIVVWGDPWVPPFDGRVPGTGSAPGLAEEQSDNVYYEEGEKSYEEPFPRWTATESIGIRISFRTKVIVKIVKINGVYYAYVTGLGYTASSTSGLALFNGSVTLMDGTKKLGTLQLPKQFSEPAIRGKWSDVGKTVFALPNNSTNDIFINVTVGFGLYFPDGKQTGPLPPTGTQLIRIGTHVDLFK